DGAAVARQVVPGADGPGAQADGQGRGAGADEDEDDEADEEREQQAEDDGDDRQADERQRGGASQAEASPPAHDAPPRGVPRLCPPCAGCSADGDPLSRLPQPWHIVPLPRLAWSGHLPASTFHCALSHSFSRAYSKEVSCFFRGASSSASSFFAAA